MLSSSLAGQRLRTLTQRNPVPVRNGSPDFWKANHRQPLPSTLFTRHNRPLHTLWLESQAWFCAHELGRMTGRFFDEHCIRKLDPDQHRTVQLLRYGQYSETTMVSESGAYTLLAHHHTPENRHLRHWLTAAGMFYGVSIELEVLLSELSVLQEDINRTALRWTALQSQR
ncbi:BRO-N domain-containing protein [Pseudomonas carassii]|uniref:Bro-N domain-containing protein n=1 Tax=Pseudomonas carassii TaxID=3115855 RepID=A0ABU7HHV4_9PSED|nr:Bro-N domain-containing protein [Pseudomonas sp. 137P]MEE1890906.1 Bro-N domain-containing protein [Pseudomonas sp. 137P]